MIIMDNKVLIKITILDLDDSFDLFIPVNEIVWKLKKLIIKAISDLTGSNLNLNNDYILINKDTGKTKTTATYYIKGAKDILEKYKNIAVWDEVDGQYYIETPEGTSIRKIWVESAESLKKKLEAAKKYDLAGIAAWRLGYESSEEWKIINNEYMK